MTDITNSQSVEPCGCILYVPEGKFMMQIRYCEDHNATFEQMQKLRAEFIELGARQAEAIKRNLEIRKLHNDAELFIDDLVGVLYEALHKIPEEDPTYQNIVNAIANGEKREER